MHILNRSSFWIILVLLLAAACTSAPQAQNLPPAADTLTPNPGLLMDASEYARQNGVSLDEAVRRLNLQGELGPLGAVLEREQAETFAGLWIVHQPNFGVVVAFTENGEETLRPYLAGKSWADLVEVRQVSYTLAELSAAQQQVA